MSVEAIRNAIWGLKPGEAEALTKEALEKGIKAVDIIQAAISESLEIVGEKWNSGEYFLVEVLIAVHAVNKCMKVLDPELKKEIEKTGKAGTVVIGTVEGDQHSIGKNIVIALMKASGLEVYDLGVDVPARAFVEKVREVNPDIVGMSALLISTYPKMKDVIDELKDAGLRDKVYIMIGGRPVNEDVAKEFGADAYCVDGATAVAKAKAFMEKKRGM